MACDDGCVVLVLALLSIATCALFAFLVKKKNEKRLHENQAPLLGWDTDRHEPLHTAPADALPHPDLDEATATVLYTAANFGFEDCTPFNTDWDLGVVMRPHPGSALAVAHVPPGVLKKVNGTDVTSTEHLKKVVRGLKQDAPVTLAYAPCAVIEKGTIAYFVKLDSPDDDVGVAVEDAAGGAAPHVADVRRNSPADRHGMRKGCEVLSVNGVRVQTSDDVRTQLSWARYRRETLVTLAVAEPDAEQPSADHLPSETRFVECVGDEGVGFFCEQNAAGQVEVTAAPCWGTPLHKAGVRKGTRILAVGGCPVRSLEDLRSAVLRARAVNPRFPVEIVPPPPTAKNLAKPPLADSVRWDAPPDSFAGVEDARRFYTSKEPVDEQHEAPPVQTPLDILAQYSVPGPGGPGDSDSESSIEEPPRPAAHQNPEDFHVMSPRLRRTVVGFIDIDGAAAPPGGGGDSGFYGGARDPPPAAGPSSFSARRKKRQQDAADAADKFHGLRIDDPGEGAAAAAPAGGKAATPTSALQLLSSSFDLAPWKPRMGMVVKTRPKGITVAYTEGQKAKAGIKGVVRKIITQKKEEGDNTYVQLGFGGRGTMTWRWEDCTCVRHKLKDAQLFRPTSCVKCGGFIWGLTSQAVGCVDCKNKYHKRCGKALFDKGEARVYTVGEDEDDGSPHNSNDALKLLDENPEDGAQREVMAANNEYRAKAVQIAGGRDVWKDLTWVQRLVYVKQIISALEQDTRSVHSDGSVV
ncbi:hypothetical protein DIPPA_28733 [Diplonema papillatum]|nr:hypothetical protein DIPPA_28733 [Diplonema papillatum]